MPTRFNANYPRLKDDDEFEELLRDICAVEWGDPRTQRVGRSGQQQWGVDIYGQPTHLDGVYWGVQCKLKPSQKSLTKSQIEGEVKKARNFPHNLQNYIIATDTPRDNKLQLIVDAISEREVGNGGFPVEIWFWPDIERRLATYPRLLIKYYHDFFASLTNSPILERLVDRRLEVHSYTYPASPEPSNLELHLQLRGVTTLATGSSNRKLTMNAAEMLPDGLLVQIDRQIKSTNPDLPPHVTMDIISLRKLVEEDCPIFILSSLAVANSLKQSLHSLNQPPSRFSFIEDEEDVNIVADRVFKEVFDYGYKRRGYIPTINVVARTTPNKPNSALLDMDWQPYLSVKMHPTEAEWSGILAPALACVSKHLTSLSEATRIQVDSTLPVPASVAIGHALNLRVALLGVWARDMGKRDVRHLWLADGEPANVRLVVTDYKSDAATSRAAVFEVTIGFSIHSHVKAFIEKAGLTCDKWVEVRSSDDVENFENVDEARAVAYADQVGRLFRRVTEQGVTDLHIFLRIPSALAVLIGQKLHACGRIHLYWFDNSEYTYKRAFTLK